MSASLMGEQSDREIPEFSDEDDHLNFFQNIDQVYCELPGIVQNYATFTQSFQIGKAMTSLIVKNALKVAEERTINKNIPISTVQEMMGLTSLLFIVVDNTQGLEVESCNLVEDEEPGLITVDRWWRSRVVVDNKEEVDPEQNDEVKPLTETQRLGSTMHRGGQGSRRVSVAEQKRKTASSIHVDVKLVELPQEFEDDEFEEKLRNAKLYELKKRSEIEQKKQEEKVQQLIEKKEGAQSKFTYDYDGKILLAKPIKMDKMQPTNQKVKIEIKDMPKGTITDKKIIPKDKDKKGSVAIRSSVVEQEIPNRTLQDRKDVSKDVTGDKAVRVEKSYQFPYDTFAMNNGVRLIYESKVKEGSKQQVTDSVEHLTYKLSGSNLMPGEDAQAQGNQIRLSRTEYQMIVDQGAQMNATAKQFVSVDQPITVQSPAAQGLDNQSIVGQQSILARKKSQGQIDKNVSFNPAQQKVEPPKSKISLKNQRMVETLISATPDTQPMPEPKAEIPKKDPKNPVDAFNQQLLQSKDWGRSSGKTAYFPPIKQANAMSKSKGFQSSLEQLYKCPRDRMVAQGMRSQNDFYPDRDRKSAQSHSTGCIQTFYTTHTKFSEKLRQS